MYLSNALEQYYIEDETSYLSNNCNRPISSYRNNNNNCSTVNTRTQRRWYYGRAGNRARPWSKIPSREIPRTPRITYYCLLPTLLTVRGTDSLVTRSVVIVFPVSP